MLTSTLSSTCLCLQFKVFSPSLPTSQASPFPPLPAAPHPSLDSPCLVHLRRPPAALASWASRRQRGEGEDSRRLPGVSRRGSPLPEAGNQKQMHPNQPIIKTRSKGTHTCLRPRSLLAFLPSPVGPTRVGAQSPQEGARRLPSSSELLLLRRGAEPPGPSRKLGSLLKAAGRLGTLSPPGALGSPPARPPPASIIASPPFPHQTKPFQAAP